MNVAVLGSIVSTQSVNPSHRPVAGNHALKIASLALKSSRSQATSGHFDANESSARISAGPATRFNVSHGRLRLASTSMPIARTDVFKATAAA